MSSRSPRQSLSKAYLKSPVSRPEIEQFKTAFVKMQNKIDPDNTEEHLKNNIRDFLLDAYYKGDYEINVSGFEVPFGSAKYYLVYQILMDEINVTYPIGGEGLVPGETETIHWDALDQADDFLIEYSENGGNTWNTIGKPQYLAENLQNP